MFVLVKGDRISAEKKGGGAENKPERGCEQ
jgi:hypothetical protein